MGRLWQIRATFRIERQPTPPSSLGHDDGFATVQRSSNADRARRPTLSEPRATDEELTPGDRVEGLGNFGKPTGELGTVGRRNEEDAVVKWDDDGRTRLAQPSLKKI